MKKASFAFTIIWLFCLSRIIQAQDDLFIYSFPPENLFDLETKVIVRKIGDHFYYSYRLKSLISSQQNIAFFYIFCNIRN